MKSLNFEFLRKHKEELTYIGSLAEISLHTDPSNTLAKSRMFAEKVVDLMYEKYNLPYPLSDNFLDRLIEDSFKSVIPKTVLDKLHTIRIQGNKGAHEIRIDSETAAKVLGEAFDIARWIYAMFWNGKVEDAGTFTLPENLQEKDKSKENELNAIIANQEKELQILLEKLESAKESVTVSNEPTPQELQEIAIAGQNASDALKFSEKETRERLIDSMLIAAGWDVTDSQKVKAEFPLENGEKVDYALFGDKSYPLAIIEAKRTSKNVESGRTQAESYANQIEKETGHRPIIFYTNGFETYLWNDAMNETPHKVFGFYSQDSLEYLHFQRNNRKTLSSSKPSAEIAGRIYQLEAIKRVAESFDHGKRKALIVQATGTGKTRVAISICELLYRTRWAKRILFLCDRRELRKQADDTFKEFVPDNPRTIVSSQTYKDRDKRIYLATYPAMMQCFESFDVGFFDLIIADESHRSIYNRYRDIFLYFDARQIGLTATPVGQINRNTYDLFDCEADDPTAHYSFEEAVSENFLVPFEVFDDTTAFLRRGIKYNQLNKEQQEKLEEDEADAESFDYETNQVNTLIFNRPTNEYILRNLMEKGIREKSGQHVGKSIVFARNHNHAVFLEKLFNELYPQYGGAFCRVIDSHDPRASELITEFKKPDSRLTVAISVDMLDTGIDISELVNLVFAKPVKSYVKFWQMIGRGTRLREHLFGLGKHKTKFYIFDHCGNFEYFEQTYREADPPVQKSLLQKLFEARIELAQAAVTAQDSETFEMSVNLIKQDIAALPESSISIKEKKREILEVQQEGVLDNLSESTINLLLREIAPLMQWRSVTGLERQYEFDLLVTRLQTAKLTNSATLADLRDLVRATVSRLPVNLNEVREKSELINNAKNITYWETNNLEDIEQLRQELRGLMRLVLSYDIFRDSPRETNIEEDETKIQSKKRVPKLEGLQLIAYRRRVQEVLENLIDKSPALQKIKSGRTLNGKDFDELCALVLEQDAEVNLRDLEIHYPDLANNLDIAIRSIIGLNPEAVQMNFEEFVQKHNLSSKQIRFLTLLKNHLSKYGTIEISRLYEPPFSDLDSDGLDGVFSDEYQISELLDILTANNLVH